MTLRLTCVNLDQKISWVLPIDMRTDLSIHSKNLFALRLLEKEAQSEALFAHQNVNSEEFQAYIKEQVIEKPKRISVGKPAFAPKF